MSTWGGVGDEVHHRAGSGHDLDVYVRGREEAPIVAEVKARKNGSGFTQLERWLGEFDVLFLRRNHAEPLVVVPWRVWAALLDRRRPLPQPDKKSSTSSSDQL